MIQILHNPRCAKSRQGLAILEASGKPFEVIKYLENIPTKNDLKSILEKLGITPMELIRTNEAIWKSDFKGKSLSNDQLIDIMLEYPKLIERPIVINGDKAVIGRPPEQILDIIT
ncbi:MAG: arsenate reductase (glutaredoxin) [Bacteroidota bacterium]